MNTVRCISGREAELPISECYGKSTVYSYAEQ